MRPILGALLLYFSLWALYYGIAFWAWTDIPAAVAATFVLAINLVGLAILVKLVRSGIAALKKAPSPSPRPARRQTVLRVVVLSISALLGIAATLPIHLGQAGRGVDVMPFWPSVMFTSAIVVTATVLVGVWASRTKK